MVQVRLQSERSTHNALLSSANGEIRNEMVYKVHQGQYSSIVALMRAVPSCKRKPT